MVVGNIRWHYDRLDVSALTLSRMVIATAGGLSSGKGTFGNFAEELGIGNVSTGALIRGELAFMGEPEPTRERQLEWGDQRRAAMDPGYWVRRALQKVPGDIIIDGIRTMGELKEVRQANGILVWFEAPLELTYKWSQGRMEERDRISFEEFVVRQNIEFGDGEVRGPGESHLSAIRSQADYVIVNDIDQPDRATLQHRSFKLLSRFRTGIRI